MPIVSREEVINCLNPIIDVFIRRQSVLLDVAELEWLIEDVTGGSPVQVEPPTGRNTADLADCPAGDHISTGRYVARFTVPTGFNLGTHRITWFFKQTLGGQEFTSQEEFEVLDVLVGSGSGAEIYATVASMRAEGFSTTLIDDATLLQRLNEASRMVDKITGRFFLPRTEEYLLNGSGHGVLFLQEPIIAISEIEITIEGVNFTTALVDLNDVAIFNRHLSQNLTRPDDRDHPRIAFKRADQEFARLHALLGQRVFYEGKQNIRVSGVFGFTDNDGTSTGKTPDLIARATRMIAAQNIAPLSDSDALFDAASTNNLKRLKTRDQEIEYQVRKGVGGLTEGPFTGDSRIDSLLLMYMRPMDMATV